MVLTIYFVICAICNFVDTKFGRQSNMKDKIRRKYRKHIGVAYLLLALITFNFFVAERIYHIKLELFPCAIIYVIPIGYIIYINKRFKRY